VEILTARGICKNYGHDAVLVEAVSDVDFLIETNEFIAIAGPSGCGKTTLLNILGCIDSPTSGELYINGNNMLSQNEDDRTLFRRSNIGFIFQDYSLIPWLTVYENIVFPLQISNSEVDGDYYDAVLDVLGLREREAFYPGELSGGQQQRVAIARALMVKPSLIFADEPTGNLDSNTGAQVLELLMQSSKAFGQAIVLITHDRKIAQTANRIVWMEDGRVVR
jgi:putative ABC transport system ATP-binding protein